MPEIEVQKKVKIKIPLTPNFIQVNESTLHISELSDKELRAIGASWTVELVRRARISREARK